MIDPHTRYQRFLSTHHLYPSPGDGTCACGCGVILTARKRRWASEECSRVAVEQLRLLKGNGRTIRRLLWQRDGGVCRRCGLICLGGAPLSEDHRTQQKSAIRNGDSLDRWEADHIIPVEQGGGACDLGNLQTLCVECHRVKTAEDRAKSLLPLVPNVESEEWAVRSVDENEQRNLEAKGNL